MSERIVISLLGGFDISADGVSVPDDAWRLRKARSLIKLLALAPGRRLHREQVSELLWPDRDAAAAANNVHQVLYQGRRALASVGVDGAAVLALRGDLVALCPDDAPLIDVLAFEAAGEAARRGTDPEAHRAALALWTGELLPEDRYEPWTEARRASVRELKLGLLVGLAGLLEQNGAAAAAAEPLLEVLREDELHEPAHRRLMRLYASSGRRQDALAQYERLRRALRKAYEADPDPETRRLYRELLADGVEAPEGDVAADVAADVDRRPAASARARRRLPVQVTSFVGRERELAEVGRLLARTRLVTLTGPGGAGKTRLALEAAGRVTDVPPDAVVLVELGALSAAALVPQAAATALGIPLPVRGAQAAALAAALGERELLLVLDNCEHLVDACAALVEELLGTCPRVRILATSREPLRVAGEVTWRVPSLELPDPGRLLATPELATLASVRLFVERAAEGAPGFAIDDGNAEAVAQICFRLDGMPLALELAAARVALLAPEQIVARLGDSLALLGSGRRRALDRQQTLAATLDWSHELLGPEERILYRRLAVFAGGFALEAVEGICDAEPLSGDRILDLLGRLVDKSLVLAEPRDGSVRYRLLETVRQDARARLVAAGEDVVLGHRHRAWFAAFAEGHDPELATTVVNDAPRLLDDEHDNLRAAISTGLEQDPGMALRIAVLLWRFWLARGHFIEGARWLDAALARAPERSALRSRALFAAVVLDARRGAMERLGPLADEAVAITRESGLGPELAQSLHLRGLLAMVGGDMTLAARVAQESRDLAEELDERPTVASATALSGLIALIQGRLGAARAELGDALARLSEMEPLGRPFFPVASPGFAVLPPRDGVPRLHFEESILLFRRVAAGPARGYVLDSLARVARQHGDPDEALRLLEEAAALFAALGDEAGEGSALAHLGFLHAERAEYEHGRERLERSLRLRRRLRDRRGIGLTMSGLGVLEAAAGDLALGRTWLGRAHELFAAMHDVPGAGGTDLNLGMVALDAGEEDEARRVLAGSLPMFEQYGVGHPWIAVAVAVLEERAGDTGTAQARLEAARELFERLGEDRGVAYCDAIASPPR